MARRGYKGRYVKRRSNNMVLGLVLMCVLVLPAIYSLGIVGGMISDAYDKWLYPGMDESVEVKVATYNQIIIEPEPIPEPEPEPVVVVEEPKPQETRKVATVAQSSRSGGGSRTTLGVNDVKALIKQVSDEIGIDHRVVEGLVYTESSFRTNVTSSTGRHHGLTQVSESNYDRLTPVLGLVPSNGTNYFDPYSNLKCGAYILQCSLIKTQDYHKSLVIYNMGEGGAKGINSSAYSRKVMTYAENLGFTYP